MCLNLIGSGNPNKVCLILGLPRQRQPGQGHRPKHTCSRSAQLPSCLPSGMTSPWPSTFKTGRWEDPSSALVPSRELLHSLDTPPYSVSVPSPHVSICTPPMPTTPRCDPNTAPTSYHPCASLRVGVGSFMQMAPCTPVLLRGTELTTL